MDRKYEVVMAALRRAADEHGAPNSFTPGELAAHYCNLTPMEIGRVAWAACFALRVRGYGATYADRRFSITRLPND
jgi:hypothetical protein